MRAPATRGDVLATAAILLVVIIAVAAPRIVHRLGAHPSEGECRELLDRYVDHVARAADPAPSASSLADRRARARAAAQGDAEFARCTTELSKAEAECALKAGGADEFERCLQQ